MGTPLVAKKALAVRGGFGPNVRNPKETFQAYTNIGAVQGTMETAPMILQSLFAGAYIAFGAVLAMSVGAAIPGIKTSDPGIQKIILGAIGLPFGLLMVVMTGGQLFTSNAALVTAAHLQGKVTRQQLLKNLLVSFVGNFAGVLAIVKAVELAGLAGSANAGVAAVATTKCAMTFSQAFIRGIMCNWMVCIALWQQAAACDLGGKFVGIVLPISAFVAMGFEHSIANMALIPLGILAGSSASVGSFLLENLAPVTLGNLVGGMIAVAASYNYLHGPPSKYSSNI